MLFFIILLILRLDISIQIYGADQTAKTTLLASALQGTKVKFHITVVELSLQSYYWKRCLIAFVKLFGQSWMKRQMDTSS